MTTGRRTTSHRGSIEIAGLGAALLAAVLLLASLPVLAHRPGVVTEPVPSAAPSPHALVVD